MKNLFLVKNSKGFLKSIEFNKKELKQFIIYTDKASEALICYEKFTYVLRFNITDFEFLQCERVEIQSDFESTSLTSDLYDKSFEFMHYCNTSKILMTINILRKDLMTVQQPLIDFLKLGHFKNNGSVLKKYQDEYKAIVNSVKSNIRFEVSSYDVIWVKVFYNGVQDGFQVLTGEREEHQVIKDYKAITVKQYQKAIKDIRDNEKLVQTIKNKVSTIKEAFYL